ncbi:hypothetical protein GCM10010331_20510 [Streptomyces xanthochromogenes]|nr:hypothetical protein GCM10010331_20510 [Streptomyces xanthochromogenes]
MTAAETLEGLETPKGLEALGTSESHPETPSRRPGSRAADGGARRRQGPVSAS